MSRKSVAVLGGSGFVGSRVVELSAEQYAVVAPTHAELDVLDMEALTAFVRGSAAPMIVSLAAWADVDGAEAERGDHGGRVYALNSLHPGRLANLCGELGKYLLHVSTDYVFDGTSAERPYHEMDTTHALSWYAETKLLGERAVLDSGATACVARIEMPFSALEHRKLDFARLCLARLKAGQPISGVVNQRITPVRLDDAVSALQVLLEARFTGIIHVAAADWTTPYQFARSIARRTGLDADLVQPTDFRDFATRRPALRPQHSWLDVGLFSKLFGPHVLRPVERELDAWAAQLAPSAGVVAPGSKV